MQVAMIISAILSHLLTNLQNRYEFANDQLPVGLITQFNLVIALHR